jgi:hypothetical protein
MNMEAEISLEILVTLSRLEGFMPQKKGAYIFAALNPVKRQL